MFTWQKCHNQVRSQIDSVVAGGDNHVFMTKISTVYVIIIRDALKMA